MENVLSRKLSTQGVGRSPISNTDRLGDSILRLIEKEVGSILKASVSGMVLENEVTRLSSVAEGIPVPALLGVFGFEGAKTRMMINMSADLVFHIVDLLMGGDPETCPVSTTRSFTAIDYSLMQDILEAIAKSFETALVDLLGGPLKSHFEILDVQQNITNVSIATDNADVLVINSALDIGDAARGGDFDIIIPLSVLDIVRSSVEKTKNKGAVKVRDIWRERMKRAAGEADIPVNAILHKAHLKAQFLENLEVGQVLPVPSKSPQNVSLVIKTAGSAGTEIATAKIGAFEGRKVLKLNTPIDPNLRNYLSGVVAEE